MSVCFGTWKGLDIATGVGDLDWREATSRAGGVNNPNRLWPVAVSGFDGLLKRKDAQVTCMC